MCFTGFAHAELHSGLGESIFDYNCTLNIYLSNLSSDRAIDQTLALQGLRLRQQVLKRDKQLFNVQ